jgi:hypothetical protein
VVGTNHQTYHIIELERVHLIHVLGQFAFPHLFGPIPFLVIVQVCLNGIGIHRVFVYCCLVRLRGLGPGLGLASFFFLLLLFRLALRWDDI